MAHYPIAWRSDRLPAVDETIERVLTTTRTWAVVGLSANPGRDSHRVARVLQRHGLTVVPVNPALAGGEVLGERAYGSLAEAAAVGVGIDVVDVFRRSEDAAAPVDEAVAIGARAVWLQLGVLAPAATDRARAAGLDVVVDRCPAIELPQLGSARA